MLSFSVSGFPSFPLHRVYPRVCASFGIDSQEPNSSNPHGSDAKLEEDIRKGKGSGGFVIGRKKKAKEKVQWVCSNCGYSAGQWWGVCRSCSVSGTMKEVKFSDDADSMVSGFSVLEDGMGSWLPQHQGELRPLRLAEVNRGLDHHHWRIPLTGPFGDEISRVLGGGLVPGSLTLIGGDPGVGKSTLLLQIASIIAEWHNDGEASPVVYVSGEESVEQIGNRANRLEIESDIYLYSSNDVEDILKKVQYLSPGALIVDSIQTVYLKGIMGSPGGIMQIGHVTKSGDIAGPRVLEHIVDVVLYMEGEKYSSHRMLRAVKNRFGSTDELGVFEMSQSGLQAVSNASEMFLSEQHLDSEILAGLAVAVIMDGSRTFLIEIQALCLSGSTGSRQVNGIQVLIKQAGLRLREHAVFLNVVSGLTLAETAGDLAIAAAICSSCLEVPIPNDIAFIGEIGLGGELRMVPRMEKRVHTVAKLGFRMCIVPKVAEKALGTQGLEKMELVGCRNLKEGHGGNLGSTRFSTSAAVAARTSSGGLFSWLTGESSSSLPPLDIPLGGVALPDPLPDYVEPSKTKITTLSNGLKIASETSANPVASIGLYLDCGSIYETPLSSGASHLLERMAFKSTTNRSHFRIVREVEAIGGNIGASASREQMGYTFDALKTYVPQMVELLVDCVRNPAFLDWEVNEELRKVKSELGELSNNPQGLLLEAIHSAGYSGALAYPLLAPESALNRLDGPSLEEFVVENYTAPRMVLAASGVEHEELLSVAEPLLSDLSNVPRPEEPKSIYVGGDFRRHGESGATHVAIAFEVPGGWQKEKDAIVLTVLQEGVEVIILESCRCLWEEVGHSQQGAPEKGCTQGYSPDFVPKAVDLAAKELIAIASPGQVTQVQLDRAKKSTKSAVLMNLESRMIASEDIGRQILTYGERKPVEQFLKAVDEITLNDITKIAQKIIASPLTMASYGDVMNVPSYESVSSKFHAK
ncbi:Mitochondrial-processing peptidase subunit alpha, partial [Mucuna pruriens]